MQTTSEIVAHPLPTHKQFKGEIANDKRSVLVSGASSGDHAKKEFVNSSGS